MAVISVIMPCLNAEKCITRGVESVLGQTFGELELIVVDNGSTDGTMGILDSFNDVRLRVVNEPRKGVSRARNQGIAEATGDFVAFLDADDTWREDCLEKLHSALEENPEVVLAYCGWQKVGLPGLLGAPYVPPDYEKEGKLFYLLRCCPWPIHAALTRIEAVRAGFDEKYSHGEDYKLWLKIAAFSRIVCVPDVMAFYHFHGGHQATSNKGKTTIDSWMVKREFLKEHHEIAARLGTRDVRQLVHGELLKSGFAFYWARDLVPARQIFRKVMRAGYGTPTDWKYMVFALLPLAVHRLCLDVRGEISSSPKTVGKGRQ